MILISVMRSTVKMARKRKKVIITSLEAMLLTAAQVGNMS